MERWICTLIACSLSLLSLGQVHLVDTSVYDSIFVKEASSDVQHFVGVQNTSQSVDAKGGLKVFITNAEKDGIIGATVQVGWRKAGYWWSN